VMLKREELQTLKDTAQPANVISESPRVANKALRADGTGSLSQSQLTTPDIRSHRKTYGLVAGLYDDSLSILLLNGSPTELEEIRALNCVTVTTVNSSPRQTFLNTQFARQPNLSEGNHTFTAYTAEAFDFLIGAEQHWDMIRLQGSLPQQDLDPLNPALAETREFFSSCFTHLPDSGFLLFESDTTTNTLEVFRRFSAASQALRRRGVSNPSQHFAVLRDSEDTLTGATVTLIFKKALDSARIAAVMATAKALKLTVTTLPGIRSAPELSASFQPGISATLSAQFNTDLSPLSIERPFPGIMAPIHFSLIQPVQAKSLADGSLSEISALLDILSAPIQRTISDFKTLSIFTALALAVLLMTGYSLLCKALNHTVRNYRRAQRRSFVAFILTLSGSLIIILSALDSSALQISPAHFPRHLLALILTASFATGIWFSSHRKHSQTRNADFGLTLALFFIPGSLALSAVTHSSPLSLLLLTVSATLLGAKSGLFLRAERLLELPRLSSALTALLFLLTAAMIATTFSEAAFGYPTTIELGIVVLALGAVLHLSRPGFRPRVSRA